MRETRRDKREPCVTARFHSLLHKQLESAGAPEKLHNFTRLAIFGPVARLSPFQAIRQLSEGDEDVPS